MCVLRVNDIEVERKRKMMKFNRGKGEIIINIIKSVSSLVEPLIS